MSASLRPATDPQAHQRGVWPVLDEEAFADWQALMLAHTGIVMPAARQEFLGLHLRDHLRAHGMPDLGTLRQQLDAHDSEAARHWGELVARLTLQPSFFFRHQASLDYLVGTWLPGHLARLGSMPLKAWNPGCGTGEETWSLAMVLDMALTAGGHPNPLEIAGSDLGHQTLAIAQRGLYPQVRLHELPAEHVLHSCHLCEDGRFSIDRRLRQRVSFHPLDLGSEEEVPFARLDLIYCQNVLIYFSAARRQALLERFTRLLAPGGLLVLGPGEAAGETHSGLRRVGARGVLAFIRQGEA